MHASTLSAALAAALLALAAAQPGFIVTSYPGVVTNNPGGALAPVLSPHLRCVAARIY